MEWKPIKTAPKDGTCVLIIGGKIVEDGCLYHDLDGPMTAHYELNKWAKSPWKMAGEDMVAVAPTHWMPMPDFPKTQKVRKSRKTKK